MDKKILFKTVLEQSSPQQAREAVDFMGKSLEGQSMLAEMIDRDAYLMEANKETQKTISPTQSDFIFKRVERQIRQKKIRKIFYQSAAIVIPFLLIVSAFFYFNNQLDMFGKTDYAEIYVAKGETMQLVFQDGSKVFLNADSRIHYPKKFGLHARKISLEGEAYFEVSENKQRPFVVNVKGNNIKVLGTSFNVKAYENDLKINVTLDEGRVDFITSVQDKYSLHSGQQLTFEKISGEVFVKKLEKSIDESSWRYDVLRFRDTPLQEILSQLNRKFNTQFKIKHPEVLKYSFTLVTSQKASLKEILKELERIAPVRFTLKNNAYSVSLKSK